MTWAKLATGVFAIAISVDLAGVAVGFGLVDVISMACAGTGAVLIYQYDRDLRGGT